MPCRRANSPLARSFLTKSAAGGDRTGRRGRLIRPKATADQLALEGFGRRWASPRGTPPLADRLSRATGFRQGLAEFGYIDGQNIIVDFRFGEGHYDRLAGLAVELLQLRPDVLVAVGTTVIGARVCEPH
jgi:hypothetical protein